MIFWEAKGKDKTHNKVHEGHKQACLFIMVSQCHVRGSRQCIVAADFLIYLGHKIIEVTMIMNILLIKHNRERNSVFAILSFFKTTRLWFLILV